MTGQSMREYKTLMNEQENTEARNTNILTDNSQLKTL